MTYDIKKIRLNILKIILPIMAANVLEMLVGLISMALIGNLGAIAIGAMGLSTRVRGIIWAIFKGISIGGQVVVAQAIGSNETKKVTESMRQTVVSMFLISLLFVVTMWLFPSSWLTIFGAKDELLKVSIDVLRISSLGIPFLGIVIIVSGILQGKGDATTPMIIGAIMNILNVIIGVILVNGLLGFPKLGLFGAAIALMLSQIVAGIISLYLVSKMDMFKSTFKISRMFSFNKSIINSVYKTGIPSALESLFWQLSTVIVIRVILSYGNDAYAAYQLGLQAESISFMPAAGFTVAATTFIGQQLGANDKELAKVYYKEIFKGSFIISLILGGGLALFPGSVLSLMTNNDTLIGIGSIYLIFCGLAQLPQNLAGVTGGALRGAGYTKPSMYSAGIGLYGFRVPMSLLIAYVFHGSINLVFLTIGIDMVIRYVLNLYFYKKYRIYENPKLV
jgi:putative MATE family efflux protein